MAGSVFLVLTGSASAGWGHLRAGGSSGGSSGVYAAGYGSSGAYASAGSGGSSGYVAYGSVGASSGGSSGGPGVLQRVASRIQSHMAAKHARHAARRAAYGSSGVYASSGGSSGYTSYSSYGSSGYAVARASSGGSSGTVSYRASRVSSGGSSGSVYRTGVRYGSTGSASYGSVGNTYYGASKASANRVPSMIASSKLLDDAVYLTVAVPSKTKIYVNDNLTTSQGAIREFVSRGLNAGKSYKFEIRAELESADGQTMVETKSLVVNAGEREQIQFAFADRPRPIETAVTLNVPEGASVSLAGNPTQAVGQSRTFRTAQLNLGEVWDDYEIQVEYEGQVKARKIRLIAGDDLELTFAFDDTNQQLVAK